jgi:peptidyl-prolyl cis-trans isomerase A (cyclophilin A)
VPRVKAYGGTRELASVKVNIPLPRVSVTLSDGTQSGSFVMELDPTVAPNTVENFMAYASGGTASFYRTTAVTYADPTMGIRLGGYTLVSSTNNAFVLKPPTRDPIPVESGNGLKNVRGAVALVQRNTGDRATEWWVNTKDNPTLDLGSAENPSGYTVFGKVVEGIEAVETAAAVPTIIELVSGSLRAPVKGVTITAITQTR